MGGRDFGRYRERYEKYHAGEDWRFLSGSNFGQPVYSIGHGEVTYAESEGWGADKGVVIVRHTFPNGRSLLSFYGHLDPPSVTLHPGNCIVRGQIVGQIGQPRTSPHLHFEIRTHFPYSTGGGYWSTDPAQFGWLPPSETIAEYRLSVAPGTLWTRSATEGISQPIGPFDERSFLVFEDDQLTAIDLQDGNPVWSHEFSETIQGMIKDAAQSLVYTLESPATLKAYALPAEVNTRSGLTPLWEHELPPASRRILLPLPGGGIFINALGAYSSQGEMLWQQAESFTIQNWLQTDDWLILATNHETALWSVNHEGMQPWSDAPAGIPIAAGDQHWLYAADGIYSLDPITRNAQLSYPLGAGTASQRAALGLPDGELLFTHSDNNDRRILALDAKGTLLWEYSYADQIAGTPQILWENGQSYVYFKPASSSGRGSYAALDFFQIDPQKGILQRVFEASSRNYNQQDVWIASSNQGQILLNINGAGLVLFDLQTALQRMDQ